MRKWILSLVVAVLATLSAQAAPVRISEMTNTNGPHALSLVELAALTGASTYTTRSLTISNLVETVLWQTPSWRNGSNALVNFVNGGGIYGLTNTSWHASNAVTHLAFRSNSVIYLSLRGGRVGVMTDDPQNELHVVGAIRSTVWANDRILASMPGGPVATNTPWSPANLGSNFVDSLNLSNYVHGHYSEGSIATNGTINLALPRQSISITNNTWLNFTGTNIQNRTLIEVINGGYSVIFTNIYKWATGEPLTNTWGGTNWFVFWTKGSGGQVYAEFSATPQGAETFMATQDGNATNATLRGTLTIDQATQDGYVLTSDGSGGATWAAAQVGGGGGISAWTNASILYVETNGFALGTAVRGRPDLPYNTLTAAVSQAQSGDIIRVGAGTHYVLDSRVALPDNVSLVGLGPHVSHIVSDSVLNGAGEGPIVNPGDNSYIGSLSISSTNETLFGACIGATPVSARAFTNVLVNNVKMFGNTDNIYLDTNELCTMKVLNCVLDGTFDNVFVDQFTNSLVHLVACDIYGSNVVNLTVNGENVRNVNVFNGRVILDNCTLRAYGGTLWGANIYTADADARVWVNNCFLDTGLSGVFNEAITNSLGNVWVDGCDVAQADVATAGGTTTFSATRKGAISTTGNITYTEGTLANVEAAQDGSNYVVNFAQSEWTISSANLTNHLVIKHCTNFNASVGNVLYTSWVLNTGTTNRHLFLCTELTNRIYGTNFLQPVTSFLLVSNAAYRIPFVSRGGNDTFAMGYPQPIAP